MAEHSSAIQTEMSKFKELLNVVKDIIEGMDCGTISRNTLKLGKVKLITFFLIDSDSDNVEISKATSKLENVLENIIKNEENRNRPKKTERTSITE